VVRILEEEMTNIKINFFSHISAYCNANNNLFIYEGKNISNNPFTSKLVKKSSIDFNNNKFIRINLINEEIKIISIKFPRRILHSMIFIPECYIFIVGGKNVKETLIYIIEENNENYEKYPHPLPYEILEPSLIYINNKYLYVFENSTIDFHILRIDLINVKPFEEVKINNYKYDMNQKFFGVAKYGNSIIFLGGQMINLFNNPSNKCFNFNYEKETVERCNKEFKPFEFLEKIFIPIKEGIYFQLVEYKEDNKYIPKKVVLIEK
jgi:hypothetical protein